MWCAAAKYIITIQFTAKVKDNIRLCLISFSVRYSFILLRS